MFRLVRAALFAGGLGILIAIVVGSGLPRSTYAASSTGTVLTTSPIAVDLTADPGSSAQTTLQVQNNSSKSVNIDVKLEKFKASGDTGKAQIYKPTADDPSASWVHFSRTSFEADPGVWNSVTMTVDLPKDAAYGYYYAVIFEPQTGASSSSISKIKGANAIFVLLNAKTNDESDTLKINTFSSNKSVYQYLPAGFSLSVHNSGNIYTAPKGSIYISRTSNGPALATLDFNHGQGSILPGTNRIFTASWRDGFPVYQTKRVDGQIVSDKNGKPVQTLHWNGNVSKFRFGKYYARLVLVYNQNGRDIPINAVVSFWVIPWWFIVVIILVLLLVGFGLWTLLKNTNKVFRWARKG